MWHGEVGSVLLRHYDRDDGYDKRLPFDAVALVKMIGPGECFIEGMLRLDGQQFQLKDWRELTKLLRENFGIKIIHAKRRNKDVAFSTKERS